MVYRSLACKPIGKGLSIRRVVRETGDNGIFGVRTREGSSQGELLGWFSDLPKVTQLTSISAGAQVLKERGIQKRQLPERRCSLCVTKIRIGLDLGGLILS